MDTWYLENLVCPLDKTPLSLESDILVSQTGNQYPVVDGVPVMLLKDVQQTHCAASSSLKVAWDGIQDTDEASRLFVDTLGISNLEKRDLVELAQKDSGNIDPVVAYVIGATSGYTYKHLIGDLDEYPIPTLRLPDANGESFLELGCNWGRWCIAAARKNYSVVGIDPSLGAIMAARRVAYQLGLDIKYVVADARYLPFKDGYFDSVFSYSVLQHMSKTDVYTILSEVEKVLSSGGKSLIQMPNWLGIRSVYHQFRRGFRKAVKFEVRYWSISDLKQVFETQVGPSIVSVDCYFGLGLQASDKHLMPSMIQKAIDLSEVLRSLSKRIGGLKYLADSVYIQSIKK